MGKKSEYLEELERQYERKHRLKLKLERELAALQKGEDSTKVKKKTKKKAKKKVIKKSKKKPSLPMLKHPKDLLKEAPLPPKVAKGKKKSENILVKEEIKKNIVEQKEIPKKSNSFIDWGDLFKKNKKEHLLHLDIIHEDDLKPKTLEEAFERKPKIKHVTPKDFKEMDHNFKKFHHEDIFNPKTKAFELINKVHNQLKHGKVNMAEYYYKQIKPMYVKLTGHDRKDVYDELVFLQNEFAMVKMRHFSKDVEEMPTRTYKLSTIMEKEREIDMELAEEKMESEEDRRAQEIELDELISKAYNKEERERERKELKRIRDIAMREKKKKARAEAKAKKAKSKEEAFLKKKKKAKVAKEKKRLKKELDIDKKITREIVKNQKRTKKEELALDLKITKGIIKKKKRVKIAEKKLSKKITKEIAKDKDKKLEKVISKEIAVEKKVMKGLKKAKKKVKKKKSSKKKVKKKSKGILGFLKKAPKPKK